MPKFNVDVKAFISVEVEAANEYEAQGRAERFVEWLSPTTEQIVDYLEDHPEGIGFSTGSFDVDGESEVEPVDD